MKMFGENNEKCVRVRVFVPFLFSDRKRKAIFFSLRFRSAVAFWVGLYLLSKINVFFFSFKKALTRSLTVDAVPFCVRSEPKVNRRDLTSNWTLLHIHFVDFVSTFDTMCVCVSIVAQPAHVLTFQLFNGFGVHDRSQKGIEEKIEIYTKTDETFSIYTCK